MTNFEYVKSMSIDDLGRFLCCLGDFNESQCGMCRVSGRCHFGGNGFVEWLKEDRKDPCSAYFEEDEENG